MKSEIYKLQGLRVSSVKCQSQQERRKVYLPSGGAILSPCFKIPRKDTIKQARLGGELHSHRQNWSFSIHAKGEAVHRHQELQIQSSPTPRSPIAYGRYKEIAKLDGMVEFTFQHGMR